MKPVAYYDNKHKSVSAYEGGGYTVPLYAIDTTKYKLIPIELVEEIVITQLKKFGVWDDLSEEDKQFEIAFFKGHYDAVIEASPKIEDL